MGDISMCSKKLSDDLAAVNVYWAHALYPRLWEQEECALPVH